MEFPINAIAYVKPEDNLKGLVADLKSHHVRIVIECGYFDWARGNEPRVKFDNSVGRETAEIEIEKMSNLFKAGAVPDYLNLDGPIRRMLRPGQDVSRADIKGLDSLDSATDQLVEYMRMWRKQYPTIGFFVLTNFPNWGWKGAPSYYGNGMFNGDYYEAIKAIIAKTRAAGIRILGVTADNPYDFTMGFHPHIPFLKYSDEQPATNNPDVEKIDWMARLLDLEHYVKSQGLEFNLIVNAEKAGTTSAQAFATQTLSYVDAYRAAADRRRAISCRLGTSIPKKWCPRPSRTL